MSGAEFPTVHLRSAAGTKAVTKGQSRIRAAPTVRTYARVLRVSIVLNEVVSVRHLASGTEAATKVWVGVVDTCTIIHA